MPGPLPQTRVTVRPDGTVVGGPTDHDHRAKYAIASNWIELVGDRAGEVAQQGLHQRGLVLWKVDNPMRVRSWTSGIEANGDIYGRGAARPRTRAGPACSASRF